MSRPTRLFFALLTLTLLAPAAQAREFGENFWIEGTSGLGGFTGMKSTDVSLVGRATVGFRLNERYGIELALDGMSDVLSGVSAGGGSASLIWFPGTDNIRFRAGAKVRKFAIEPSGFDDLFCWETCSAFQGGETTDAGLELGFLSQWNMGRFFVAVEWFGLYQPLVTLEAHFVDHLPDGTRQRTKAEWDGIDLPAELRFATFGAGLTF